MDFHKVQECICRVEGTPADEVITSTRHIDTIYAINEEVF